MIRREAKQPQQKHVSSATLFHSGQPFAQVFTLSREGRPSGCGYFDNAAALTAAIASRPDLRFYANVHPIKLPDEIGRGRIGSADVLAYQTLFLDIDPVRLDTSQNCNATDSEKTAAFKLAREVREALSLRGWGNPCKFDTGNGVALLYRIESLPTSSALIKRVLAGLAATFDNDNAHIDRAVFDPPRIAKLPDSFAGKGTATEERPDRFAAVVGPVPEVRVELTEAQLEAVAVAAPVVRPQVRTAWTGPVGARLNVPEWMASRGLALTRRALATLRKILQGDTGITPGEWAEVAINADDIMERARGLANHAREREEAARTANAR